MLKTDKPKAIIFDNMAVKGILQNRKTMARLPFFPSDDWALESYGDVHKMQAGEFVIKNDEPITIGWGASNLDGSEAHACPYHIGDILYVKERFNIFEYSPDIRKPLPLASIPCQKDYETSLNLGRAIVYAESDLARQYYKDCKFRSPVLMPFWLSRIHLKITDIKAQRIQDITATDCIKEGIEQISINCSRDGQKHAYKDYSMPDSDIFFNNSIDSFRTLWNRNNAKKAQAWSENDWVWVISFERINA